MDHFDFMSSVKEMESQIMEEVTGAQEYMNCSEHWKSDPTISSTYAAMAKQELEHAKNINSMLSSMKEISEDQKTIIKFLVEMNNDQIRRVSNR